MRGRGGTAPPHPRKEEEPSRSKGATNGISAIFFSTVAMSIIPKSRSKNNNVKLSGTHLLVIFYKQIGV
ncbi:MAG: hypothetical protein AMJ88_04840 [Anaerolineae bacterium SM23_ 63]|nr:MAG: hypothetical protein AMJ88_04840 [Anaerolineae bacterium SM23_ 63]